MKNDEVRRVHINECVRDSELDELDALSAAADPGDWRVYNTPAGPEVQRYGAKPLEKREASLCLMARAVTAIPRLVRGIRALEEALRSAWATADCARRELMEERKRHAADIGRCYSGRTGPDTDIDALAEAIELGEFSPRPGSIGTTEHRRQWLARTLRMWASGVSIQEHSHYRIDLAHARRRKAEEDRIRDSIDRDDARARAEVCALLAELKLKKREREQVAARVKAAVDGAAE